VSPPNRNAVRQRPRSERLNSLQDIACLFSCKQFGFPFWLIEQRKARLQNKIDTEGGDR